MTLIEVRVLFRTLLNRGDCTAEQEDNFLKLALGRIQRELRAPCMERVQYTDAVSSAVESIAVPPDFIEQIELMVGTTSLDRSSYRNLRKALSPSYARYGNLFYFEPAIPVGSRLEILYYGEFSPFTREEDANEISASSPEMLVYAALSYAGDFFEHDKRGEWEARYTSLLGAVQEQANRDEFSGGSMAVQPCYLGA